MSRYSNLTFVTDSNHTFFLLAERASTGMVQEHQRQPYFGETTIKDRSSTLFLITGNMSAGH